MLGHADLGTTERYTHVSDRRRREVYFQRAPACPPPARRDRAPARRLELQAAVASADRRRSTRLVGRVDERHVAELAPRARLLAVEVDVRAGEREQLARAAAPPDQVDHHASCAAPPSSRAAGRGSRAGGSRTGSSRRRRSSSGRCCGRAARTRSRAAGRRRRTARRASTPT